MGTCITRIRYEITIAIFIYLMGQSEWLHLAKTFFILLFQAIVPYLKFVLKSLQLMCCEKRYPCYKSPSTTPNIRQAVWWVPGELQTSISTVLCPLTHWGRDQIDAISQTTFSNAFSRMKMKKIRLGFQWSLFVRFELTIFQHWLR